MRSAVLLFKHRNWMNGILWLKVNQCFFLTSTKTLLNFHNTEIKSSLTHLKYMKPVLHRLEQISSGRLNTAVRTAVGFSLAFFLCCANTFQNIIRFNADLLGHTMMGWTQMASSDRPWTFDFDRLLSYRLVFMNLPGGSVVFHILVISSRSKLKREGFTDAPFGHGRFDWKEERDDRRWCVNERQLQPADGRGLGARFRHHTRDGFAAGTKQHSAEQDSGRRADTGPNVNTGP